IFWLVAPGVAVWLCLTKKINTIVVQGPLLEGLLGIALKKILQKELIVELHGDWEERLPALKGVLTFFAKKVLRSADKIRAVADYLVLKSKKYAPDKPYFIFPTFTDLNDFLAEKDIQFNSEILFVGRNDRVKGIPYLVEAFELIKKDFPGFKLSLVGEGLPEGKLPLTEVRNRMKNCYCLVLPSITEGLPRVILEAMALAKPVVASQVGGIPDLVKDGVTGFLFEAGNVKKLAEKLRILLSNKEMAVEMGKRGRELVQGQFSNENYISNYLAMIG
ncbi:MAG: glycosyltransferase family 4 protein, partial [Smithellaceae bacterium]|nr:glycosyltransferase family 4 protein [Smithellaceae bacterium]